MTTIELKENSSALDCIAADLTNVDKIEVMKNVSDYLRKLARSDVDPKAYNDQITALCNRAEKMVSDSYKVIETLREVAIGNDSNHEQACSLLTRCLETGAIRVEELRPLWNDIHAFMGTKP
jgi:hypothetical protein